MTPQSIVLTRQQYDFLATLLAEARELQAAAKEQSARYHIAASAILNQLDDLPKKVKTELKSVDGIYELLILPLDEENNGEAKL